jgi:hypothetical protein
MSYNPATDFLALLRLTGGGVRSERMPGLDYVVSALARAGLFALSVGQTAPTVNQAATAWLQPAQPSWLAEGTFYLWDAVVQAYVVASPALWQAFLTPSGAVFQSLAAANNAINSGVSLAAVQRAAPANTGILLPALALQYAAQKDLDIVDYSTGVVNHAITLTTPDGAEIMQKAQWELLSTADQLAGIKLRPSPDLNAWIIAP